MTDAEWQKWQQTFRRKEGVMPQIVKQVRRARLGIAVGQALFAVIALSEVATGVSLVVAGPLASDRLVGVFLVGFVAAMAALFVVITRGMHRQVEQTPEAMLSYMDRTFLAQQRAGALARWGGVVACSTTAAFVLWGFSHGRGSRLDLVLGLGFVLLVLVTTWLSPVFVQRKIAKRRAQLDAWKRELES